MKALTYLILNLQIRGYSIMKKGILILLLVISGFAHGQSLKEALFSGKLKNKPGSVVRKGDDLTAQQADTTAAQTDTAYKISTNDSGKVISATGDTSANRVLRPADPGRKELTTPTDSGAISTTGQNDSASVATDTAAPTISEEPKEVTPAPKTNNALFKEYIDSVSSILKTEVIPSKKVKKETYYMTVSYTIGTDGQVEITDVAVSPENSFLQEQVKSRLMADAPKLSPVLSSTGAPRKVNRRHNFTVTKE